ncbi:probable 39S ribosomal protein L49, mitochondrial [Teleopsis dalmanni]|uniref:probable 39S ribosomal protein L49, mitochondrial n=1 Tax=Teleopsis dalmanni TaxID=139649 RepID=UPI000D329C1C|nr:probable 39S ribosomal protein L49, mitochondrial [Teleopsis dalmanni]
MAGVQRHLFSTLIGKNNIKYQLENIIKLRDFTPACLTLTRYSSFQSSPKVRPLEEYPNVEVVHNPPEWKYVERVLPQIIVPKPEVKKEYPSGWKLPTALNNPDKLKYYVARTANHMIPVYLKRYYRGQRRITAIRRIQGDIWALEKDLRAVVEKSRDGKTCASRVNEMSRQIYFHGDYVDVVREFLKDNGY